MDNKDFEESNMPVHPIARPPDLDPEDDRTAYSAGHQQAAMSLHMLIILINGVLALGCIIGGIYAVAVNSASQTEINILGIKVSTGSVGVAFIAIGLIIAYKTVTSVLKNQSDLAALPSDRSRKRKRRKK